MTDANKLVESLRTMRSSARRHHDGAGGKVRWSVVLDESWRGDLSDAADLIERQAAEIQSLKEAAHGISTLAGELAADLDKAKAPAVLLTDKQLRAAYFSIDSGPDHGRTGIREERLMAVQAAVLAANGKAVA